MSYDIFFKLGGAVPISSESFVRHFESREHYEIEGAQAWYRNEDTGTYFFFELDETGVSNAPDEDQEAYFCSFNINYFRPSYFAAEAEPEIRAFVQAFDLHVEDPQTAEMGTGSYSADDFLREWARGNEFGYQAVMSQSPDAKRYTLPTAEIERAWRWNAARKRLQTQVGEGQFIPRVMFFDVGGEAKTAAVWPDAISSILPKVDILIIIRDALAPRRFLRRVRDTVHASWDQVEPHLLAHAETAEGQAYSMRYSAPPASLAKFVTALPPATEKLKGIAADSVLNAELVASASAH